MFIDKFVFWTSQMWKTFLLKLHQEVFVCLLFRLGISVKLGKNQLP